MATGRVAKHGWHLLDAGRQLEVRQATNRLRVNRWEVRDTRGDVARLDDADFNRLRSDPGWLSPELRGG